VALNMDDPTRAAIDDLRHEIEVLQIAVYGNRKEPPNGGGVYGELRRMRDEIRSNGQDRKIALAAMEKRMETLEDKVDAIDRRIRPRWWDWVIVAGGFAIMAMFAIQLAELLRLAG
jgi:hypothetical protein